LQFAKASAATLLQQEKNDSADVQRGRLNISNFICTVVSNLYSVAAGTPALTGQRAARREVQKHKPTPLNISLGRSSSAFNFNVDKGLGEKGVKMPPPPRCHRSQQFFVQPSSNLPTPPCKAASFEVSSEPHTGARPSVRLCVGLIRDIDDYHFYLLSSSNSSIEKSYDSYSIGRSLLVSSSLI
jgi:hypothetical protein